MPAKKTSGKKSVTDEPAESVASELIEARIRELEDWRGEILAQVRALICQTDPDIIETWKWSVPVWERHGILCTGETYKTAVKLTFPKGAQLPDSTGLFNSSLEGSTRRAIDIRAGETINRDAFQRLIRDAIELNATSAKGSTTSQGKPPARKRRSGA